MPRGIYRFDEIASSSTAKKKPVEEDKYTYIGLEHLDSGCLQVKRYGSDTAPIGDKLIMKKGDVLFGRRRAYQKKVAIAPFDGIFSAHGMVLRPKEDVIAKEFFPFFISSDYFLDAAIKISVGSLSPTINWADLKQLEFFLPPIEEQKEYAKVTGALIETKEAYERLLAATEELVLARFVEMFGDPVENSNDLGIVPLGSLLQSIRYGTSTPPPYSDSGFAFIRATNIKKGRIVPEDMKFISPYDTAKIDKCKLSGGEIIIVRSGVNTGDTCIVTDDYKGQYAGYDLIIELNNEEIHPVFLNELLNTHYMQKVVKPLTHRSAQPHLNAEQIQSLPIIKAPLSLQQQFAGFVSQTDKTKLEITCHLQTLENTYKALLQQCFN